MQPGTVSSGGEAAAAGLPGPLGMQRLPALRLVLLISIALLIAIALFVAKQGAGWPLLFPGLRMPYPLVRHRPPSAAQDAGGGVLPRRPAPGQPAAHSGRQAGLPGLWHDGAGGPNHPQVGLHSPATSPSPLSPARRRGHAGTRTGLAPGSPTLCCPGWPGTPEGKLRRQPARASPDASLADPATPPALCRRLVLRRGLMRATLHLVNREFEALADDFVTLGMLPKAEVGPAAAGGAADLASSWQHRNAALLRPAPYAVQPLGVASAASPPFTARGVPAAWAPCRATRRRRWCRR